jgi:hypothetical protein
VILRHATDADAEALHSFDVGDTSIPWLAEVAEIVAGLLGWRSDPAATDEDRQVVIAERNGENRRCGGTRPPRRRRRPIHA